MPDSAADAELLAAAQVALNRHADVVRDIGGVGTRTEVIPRAINAAGTIAVGGDGTGAIKWLMQP